MRARVYVANALPVDLARIGQEQGLSGSTFAALGFGEWGVEPTTIIELEGVDRLDVQVFMWTVFTEYPNEEALYVELNADALLAGIVDGEGQTIYRRGTSNIPDFTTL